ncbi:nucleolar protein 8 isoform X2 [Crotalus tigris]|uniref:nucleolar protein 8 isoform X2 n=1 Tax=Crotalus tigris TaxID=88082 RepID=UPI00192F71CE|nr:nucleolar protein 8 isoform X2 [Crotalus tigris]
MRVSAQFPSWCSDMAPRPNARKVVAARTIPWTFVEFLNMEQISFVRRLYIGGLGHSVSEDELYERFSKFGNVTETEIISRKDEHGNPTKTFAYLNILLSEKALKKCISVLNKTKWKGGTLQIELAKESFLHRLARERQEASVTKEKTNYNGMTDIQESLKKSGVIDYCVKAVPGTEIPNHKDWVVSKFGRVLPILHLKDQHKSKIMKYDPSKYCQNLKKLDQEPIDSVPISQLTWHLEEADSIMSKKRQGQFPEAKKPSKKKIKIQDSDSLSKVESNPANVVLAKQIQNCTSNSKKQANQHSSGQKLKAGTTSSRHIKSLCGDDIDSEEEIRAIEASERKKHKGNCTTALEDNMEVVGDDFKLKYNTHWSLRKANKHIAQACSGLLRPAENESDYDSVDTDEIIAVTKLSHDKERNESLQGSKETEEQNDGQPKRTIHAESSPSSGSKRSKAAEEKRAESEKPSDAQATLDRCRTESEENSNSCSDTSESEGDENYESMIQSGFRLDLTLEDLEKLAGESSEDSEEDNKILQSTNQSQTNYCPGSKTGTAPETPTISTTSKKCICPEEILAAILKEERFDKDDLKRKQAKGYIQPFKGLGSLIGVSPESESDVNVHEKKQSSFELEVESLKSVTEVEYSSLTSKKLNSKPLSLKDLDLDIPIVGGLSRNSSEPSDHLPGSIGKAEKISHDVSIMPGSEPTKHGKSVSKGPTTSSLTQNKDLNGSLKNEGGYSASPRKTKKSDNVGIQLEDNEKRLAAIQERQKEWELQKIIIQEALTSQQIQSTNKQKHIVFDSDTENEVQEHTENESSEKISVKEFTPKTSGKLFDSSDEDSDTAADENDRFKIKPQFEGKAGEKLMRLQSHFGTDERFRMDAHFLESDSDQEEESKKSVTEEEEELSLEKKKNLEILKNLLHIDVDPPKRKKLTAEGQKFRDMNTLRYDPTRQDHAVFEKKPANAEKESKAKKKKKKEEAQKLPEVSKDTFYNVAVDLKEALGSTKQDEKTEIISWDQHDDAEQTPSTDIPKFSAEKQDGNGGFTFSFFGDEVARSPIKEDSYVVEILKPSRVAWQEDPRFQDSSSEDEESEAAEVQDVEESSPAEPHSNIRFFFFSQDDDRLKGPKLFYKASDLDEEAEDWESRRQILLEDCRKKHKDARRKVKTKH